MDQRHILPEQSEKNRKPKRLDARIIGCGPKARVARLMTEELLHRFEFAETSIRKER